MWFRARQNTQCIITHIQTVIERIGEQIHYEENSSGKKIVFT